MGFAAISAIPAGLTAVKTAPAALATDPTCGNRF